MIGQTTLAGRALASGVADPRAGGRDTRYRDWDTRVIRDLPRPRHARERAGWDVGCVPVFVLSPYGLADRGF
jgi:hypothetical protein